MSLKVEKDYLLRTKIIATLLKLADNDGVVDFEKENIHELWRLSNRVEKILYDLDDSGVINFDVIGGGDDGYNAAFLGNIKPETYDYLLTCVAHITNDKSLLGDRITSLLNYDPNKLIQDIENTESHIKKLKKQIRTNNVLQPLKDPLSEIEEHFSSISKVAYVYDDVYKNILKPVQEEGKSGIRATKIWAIIGIVFSVLIANYEKIKLIIEAWLS